MKVVIGSWRRPLLSVIKPGARFSSSNNLDNNEYRQKAIYPPILDTSEESVNRRAKEAIYEKFKNLHTVEEKLFAVNIAKYYGWRSLILNDGVYPYNFLPFVKHITRTKHFKGNKDLLYKVLRRDKDLFKELVEKIRPEIQQAVLFELKGRRWQHDSEKNLSDSEMQDIVGKSIVRQINNILISSLSSQQSYLLDSVVDYEPRVESFWNVGGFYPSEREIQDAIDECEKNKKTLSEEEKSKVEDRWIQFLGTPCLQVRVDKPLPILDTEVLEQSDLMLNKLPSDTKSDETDSGSEFPVPHFPYDPSDSYGLHFERRHGTNLPGFWPGDTNEFGLISYHLSGHLLDRPPHFGESETSDTLAAQAILSSFAWLHAQSCYQGFTTYHELTYPLVNQCIVTDGHYFSSHVYQLNTVLFHSDNISTNPRVNICLSLPYQPLYTDIQNNQFVGWNDEVLETLILLYLNKPVQRKGVNLKPYLHQDEKHLADIKDEEVERRAWLHDQFRHMYTNRPRSRLPYEIYDWERIYKIRFETRPHEARLRPFELDCNPLEDRKYYQHMHKYIPRAQRTRKKHWTGWRAKFAKTYYPEIEF